VSGAKPIPLAVDTPDGPLAGAGCDDRVVFGFGLDLLPDGRERPREREKKGMSMEKPKSVEAYMKALDMEQRAALQKLRETIAAAAPEADEGITYSMPGFLLGGKGFVAYAAFNDHYSFFPMSGQAIDAHREELGERVTGKGTIQFRYGERFPAALVKKVVRTRLAEASLKRKR
jgi:uncharacterized protein YdhG (YjbR/CyaY superfamily)